MEGNKQRLSTIYFGTQKKKKKNVKIELQWRNKNAFGSIQKCLVSFHVEIEKTQGLAATEENIEKGKKKTLVGISRVPQKGKDIMETEMLEYWLND